MLHNSLSIFRCTAGFCAKRRRYFAFFPRHVCIQTAKFSQNFYENARFTYEFQAGPWGKFVVNTKHFDSIIIVPLNAHIYPAQNKVFVNCMKGNQVLDQSEIQIIAKFEDNVVTLNDVSGEDREKLSCHVQLPLKMGKLKQMTTFYVWVSVYVCYAPNLRLFTSTCKLS